MNPSIHTPAVRHLLSLVRASLWQREIEFTTFHGHPADWDEIGKLAMQQTVGGLAFTAALTLPADLRPPKEWIRKAYTFIERNRLTHCLLDRNVVETTSQLTAVGIRPILLKGQAYARAYPDPTLRHCGDIDLYVGEENYRNAYLAVKRFGWQGDEKFIPDVKHYGCDYNKVHVELHRVAAILPKCSADRSFRQWSHEQLKPGRRSLSIQGEEINVPTPLFDVIFVFNHLYHHFIAGGIGLRQVCDWVMQLHHHRDAVDTAELERLLKEFGLKRAWSLFTPIAVELLGLPADECPLYSPRHRRMSNHILGFILREGNFGRAKQKQSRRPKAYLPGKVYSLGFLTARLCAKLRIDPPMVWSYYSTTVKTGLKIVKRDIFSKL